MSGIASAHLPSDIFTLSAHDVRKSFGGVEVLHGVDLRAIGGRVLALLGENGAGKSTLVRVLAGDYQLDGGSIEVCGEIRNGFDPIMARGAGVRMIFQEFTDAPTLTVAENISLGRWERRWGLVNWPKMRRRAVATLGALGAELDPEALVGSLRVGERQLVEIARALSDEARCLILDEPTAALSSDEVERLFRFVRKLRAEGVAIIYITHRLDEVAAIADDVVVLRDGRVALEGNVNEMPRSSIISAMVGRVIGEIQRPAEAFGSELGAVRVDMRGASSPPAFNDLDLTVRGGEVVALYGKVGSGIAEVVDAIFGLKSIQSGTIKIDGSLKRYRSPQAAIKDGLGYLPSDRQREGAFMIRPIRENVAAPSWPRLAQKGFIHSGAERDALRRWQRPLRISGHGDGKQPITTLSGGNQQKVLLARWLECKAEVLLLIEPTRGVDVGARQDIYRGLRSMAEQGAAILVATSDYEEVVQLADRAVVLARGLIVAEFDGADITTTRLTDAAGG